MADHDYGTPPNLERQGEGYILKTAIDDVKREQAAQKKREDERREQEVANQTRQVALNTSLVRLTGSLVVLSRCGTAISVWQSRIAERTAQAAMQAAITANEGLEETRKATAAAAIASRAAENQLPIQLGQLDVARQQASTAVASGA